MFALSNPVFTGLYLLAILLARQHGASPATIGLMLAVMGVGGVLGAIASGALRRAMTARTLIVTEQWILVALVLALLLAHSALLIGLLIAAAELVTPAVNSVVAGSRVAATPDHLQGRVQAASTMLAMSLGWLGPLGVGLLYQDAGSTATILGVGGWALTVAAVATLAPALHGKLPQPTPETSG